jgi:hypothetical protein
LLLGSLVGIYGAVYERFGMLWALIPALTIFWALSAFWPKGEDS